MTEQREVIGQLSATLAQGTSERSREEGGMTEQREVMRQLSATLAQGTSERSREEGA